MPRSACCCCTGGCAACQWCQWCQPYTSAGKTSKPLQLVLLQRHLSLRVLVGRGVNLGTSLLWQFAGGDSYPAHDR